MYLGLFALYQVDIRNTCVRVDSSKSTAKERKKDRFLNDGNFARVASERARARLPTAFKVAKNKVGLFKEGHCTFFLSQSQS